MSRKFLKAPKINTGSPVPVYLAADCSDVVLSHVGLRGSFCEQQSQSSGADELRGLQVQEVTSLCQCANCYTSGLGFNFYEWNLLHCVAISVLEFDMCQDQQFRIWVRRWRKFCRPGAFFLLLASSTFAPNWLLAERVTCLEGSSVCTSLREMNGLLAMALR